MSIERARSIAVTKPWGSHNLESWSNAASALEPIGEIWFQRTMSFDEKSDLLFKLLFTTKPLSIQVHPDDDYARGNNEENGKTEAWYILAAKPGAKVGVGLTIHLNKTQMLEAINDGSIEHLLNWLPVKAGDVVFIPAGTIHAIGPDLVIAEIQQASDTTYRLFDYGRSRPLHAQEAVDCAKNTRADIRRANAYFPDDKRLLVACPYFTFVSLDLPAYSRWTLRAQAETWALALDGEADFGGTTASPMDAFFIKSDSVNLTAGPQGFRALVATASSSAFATLLTSVASAFPLPNDLIPTLRQRNRQSTLVRRPLPSTIEATL